MKRMWSDKKKRIIIRLFTVLFAVSVSAAVIPGGIINAYGLFGEVKAFAATEERQEQEKEKKFCSNRIILCVLSKK